MPLRATTPLVVLLLASPALLCQSAPSSPTETSSTQVAAASPHGATPAANPATPGDTPPASSVSSIVPAKESSALSRVLFYYPAARDTVEKEVHAVPSTDAARLDRLRAAFRTAGCDGSRMKHPSPTSTGLPAPTSSAPGRARREREPSSSPPTMSTAAKAREQSPAGAARLCCLSSIRPFRASREDTPISFSKPGKARVPPRGSNRSPVTRSTAYGP